MGNNGPIESIKKVGYSDGDKDYSNMSFDEQLKYQLERMKFAGSQYLANVSFDGIPKLSTGESVFGETESSGTGRT